MINKESIVKVIEEQLERPDTKEINGQIIFKIQNARVVSCEFKLEVEGKKDLTK